MVTASYRRSSNQWSTSTITSPTKSGAITEMQKSSTAKHLPPEAVTIRKYITYVGFDIYL